MTMQPPQDWSVEFVLPALASLVDDGRRVCLATLVRSDGSSPRPAGSQMAIADDGRHFGYLTGGCAEQAIADEGVKAIAAGRGHVMRFGVGSPYIDIQLPCGAGIDVWFDPCVESATLDAVLADIRSRRTTALDTSTDGTDGNGALPANVDDALADGSFRRIYTPSRRLVIVGAGPIVTALARQALALEQTVEVLTPDAQTLAATLAWGVDAAEFSDVGQLKDKTLDSHTAAVLLFHEHEREPALLQALLRSSCYYIGALGSRRTHAVRLEALNRLGVAASDCERIRGPVGLDIGAASAAEIAVSILGEMTRDYRRRSTPVLYTGASFLKA